jgi:DNA-binding winged helix-turn-helix (wHTH) protein
MRYVFGDCVLDEEERKLTRAGERVHLSPKAFELLLALLANRPRVLDKAKLRRVLWPDTHVQDANLPNLATELRTAIGDPARDPRYVRTVHGVGYAFCGAATVLVPAEGLAPTEAAPFAYRLAWAEGVVALTEGEYVIGRHPGSIVPIAADGVSRRHARLVVGHGQAVLEDLGSRNGTFVGDERVTTPRVLRDGAAFRLGSLSLTFRAAPAPSISETQDDA